MPSFNKILNDIKTLKIQGATNVAKAGIKALKIQSDATSIRQIINSRSTEPCLQNAIKYAKFTNLDMSYYFLNNIQKKVVLVGEKIIKTNSKIFTHCHSTTVTRTIIKAKENNKKIEVFNTETRPLYQGRKTTRELISKEIKTTHIVDSAAHEFLKKSDIFLLGADMVNEKGEVANKIGSNLFAEIAYIHKIPLYICTNSWKFSKKDLKIEQRNSQEVWDQKSKYLTIENPAFEKINPKYIKGIISELGVLSVRKFLKTVKKTYPWIK
jgi:translation initiation factor 2B subunit (eIF-2B alpha/beta/delta family)